MAKLLIILAGVLVFGSVHSMDQQFDVTITPAVPAGGEPFVVVFRDFDSFCDEQHPAWSLSGQRLILDLRTEYVCGPNLGPFYRLADFRFEIQGLAPGRYDIEVYYNAETQTYPPVSGVVVTVATPVPIMTGTGIFLMFVIIGLTGMRSSLA